INYSQGALVTKDVSFITRSGNINYSLNPAYSYSHHYFSPPTIFADNSIMFYSGNNIILENIQIKTPNEISLTALGNIFINRDESLLFNLLPEMRKKTSLSDLVSNIGIWESMGDINLTAGKNIVSQGIKYIAGKNITFTTGKDIFLASKPIKDVDPFFANINYPQLRSKIVAKNNILMNAARDIDLTSVLIYSNNKVTLFAGQNINLGATNYSALRNPDTDFKNNQNAITTIVADKGITISASEQLVAKGSYFQSEDDITISTGSDMQLGAVQAYSYTESESELEEHHKQVGTVINSGNKITLLSEGSILFQASELKANKEINSFAQGGFLYAQAMEESSYYEEEKKKCNWWTLCATKKKYTKTFYNKNNKVTEFNANGDIHLFAYDDITLEATKVNTKNNASIISKTGSIYFKAVKDVTFKQIITESQDIYITHRNQGYFNETWQLPALHIGGKLTIDAPKIISADVKAQKEESLEQALTILSNTPGYEWLSELQESENVNWNLVKETYSSWDEETQRINPVFGAFIAIGVAIATYGSSLATTVGGMASEVATAAGASAGIASSASVAAQAGFVSLASQAAVSLVENKGDIYKTFKSLGNSDTVKSVFTSMVVAGALHGLDQFMGWDQTIQGGTLPSTGKLLITDNATWSQVAQRVASHSIVSSTLGTAIQGGRFIDNFKIALLSNLGSQFHAEGANLIGNNGEILGHAGKILSHAVIAGVSAEIAGENVNGAIAGAIAAEIAAITINDNLIKTENWREEQAQKSRLIGAFAGLLATGKAEGVFSGANSAELVERFNRQLHVEEIKAVKELANGDNHKLERLLAASCRKTYCIAQESLSSSERIYYESLMKKYPYTHMEDSLLSDYWITKERTRIGGNYPIFSGHEKVKLFTYGDADKLTDSETFAKNQWIENASEVTGWDKKTLENLTTLITVGSSLTRANRIYGSISFKANKTQFVSIKDIYFIDKSGNKITMKWMYQGTPEQQGMTFENYIGLSNKRLT
ncbi:DUF637 domain-containing protein, partial [Proteus myxofaciens]|uniref:DUF637 domain-containing protein n=1 Tax=Proteus myxofaciens TaxID=184072 RepID=UPI0014289326